MGNKAAYISKKQSWLRFSVSLFLGIGIAALLCSLWRGPELGYLYDFLLRRRPELPIAREILIIDTIPSGSGLFVPDPKDNILEPSAVASLLLTITEFNASAIILQAPVLGLSAGGANREEEIRYHFDREFTILNRNIRNFFDAIRTGSIAPAESNRYVGELLELSERGKERLVSTLVSRDEEGIERLEKASMIFGNVRRPGDLLVQVIRTGEADRPLALADQMDYSRAVPDKDGVLRRIAPMRFYIDGNAQEHIIWSALKGRFSSYETINTESGVFLSLLERDNTTLRLPLDLSGALLFEVPARDDDFRRINLEEFLRYNESNQSLRRLLGEASSLGFFAHLEGEDNPVFLYDYALALEEDLLAVAVPYGNSVMEERKTFWKYAKIDYYASLDRIFFDAAEIYRIVNNEENFAPVFTLLEDKYNEVMELRELLGNNLPGSFCILGPGSVNNANNERILDIPPVKPLFPYIAEYISGIQSLFPTRPERSFSDTEVSALLANSILSGRSVTPGAELWLFVAAVFAAICCAVLLRSMKVISSLLLGIGITLVMGLGFSLFFIFTGRWFDPLVPAAAAGMVTVVSFLWALILKQNFNRRFRICYGPFINLQGLRRLIREGKPRPTEIITQSVAIVAVKNPELILQEDRDKSQSAARAILAFREKASMSFKKAGAMVAGNGGDLVLACFGSPPERVILGKNEATLSAFAARGAPAIRAVGFIAELLKSEESRLWSFGIDTGLCAFTWSEMSGYSVFGRPVIRSRILSGLTERYHARILVSGSVNEVLPDLPAKRLGVLKERDGTRGESFYELLL